MFSYTFCASNRQQQVGKGEWMRRTMKEEATVFALGMAVEFGKELYTAALEPYSHFMAWGA